MAGGGTIPIEASLIDQNIPAGYFRSHFALQQLRFMDSNRLETMREQAREGIKGSEAIIGASDRYQKNVSGILDNMKALQLEQKCTVYQGLAEKMDYMQKGDYQLMVTNPPFGLRIKTPGVLNRLIESFPQKAIERGVEEIVVLTPRFQMMQKSLQKAGYAMKQVRKILYGRLRVYMIKAGT